MVRRTLLALLVAVLPAAASHSGHSCCSHCGCSKVKKICVPVCETIKETTYEYECVCEDFCVPGPSKCVGTRCEPGCDGCPKCVKVMQPTCASVHTRTKLIKVPVVKEKCVTKWVVKTVCCGCNGECGCTSPGCIDCTTIGEQTAAPLPPPMPSAEPTPTVAAPAAASRQANALPSLLFR